MKAIVEGLVNAKSPLIITTYIGRNPVSVKKLVDLSVALAIPVYLSCPTTVNFPSSHPHLVGLSIGNDKNEWLRQADVILIIDSDIPFIPVHNRPRPDAKIFHIDVDVLKDGMGMFHVDASLRCKADAEVALDQVLVNLPVNSEQSSKIISARAERLAEHGRTRIAVMDNLEQSHLLNRRVSVQALCHTLRGLLPKNTLILNESTTNLPTVWAHMRADAPSSMLTSGSSSLGWGLGAAIGASLGNEVAKAGHEFIVLIVGDGSYLFGVPSSAYWIARRYNTVRDFVTSMRPTANNFHSQPFLTIVLNNGGWNVSAKIRFRFFCLIFSSYTGSEDVNAQRLSVGTRKPGIPDRVNRWVWPRCSRLR